MLSLKLGHVVEVQTDLGQIKCLLSELLSNVHSGNGIVETAHKAVPQPSG